MSYLESVNWGDVAAFRAVAEELSFTRASRRLHLTQTAVSRRVARLEQHLGMPLFVRSTRRVTLTAAGRELLAGVSELEASWHSTRLALRRHLGPQSPPSTVRLGGHKINLGELLPALRAMWPVTRWTTRRIGALEALPALRPGGELDLYLAARFPGLAWRATGELQERRLLSEPLWIAMHRDHPAARGDVVDILDLEGEDWIITAEPGAEQAFIATCRAVGFTPRVAHLSDGLDGMRSMLVAGTGVALAVATARTPEQVRVLPWLDGPSVERLLVWHPDQFPTEQVDPVADTLMGWHREEARRSPRYWQWITDHPEGFSELLAGGAVVKAASD